MLERSVGLDSTYAPAWRALGERYYYDSHYSDGGEAMFQRSTAAHERALALDPDYSDAAGMLITNRVERGELGKAYKDAKALVARHPENAMAHFALSYVLRYGGMLQEAAQECDKAVSLDPGNYQFRSCSLVFDLMGNSERAMDFLRLDPGSGWVSSNLPLHFERAGKPAEARESAEKIVSGDPSSGSHYCLSRPIVRRPSWTKRSAQLPRSFSPIPIPRTGTGTPLSWLPAENRTSLFGCSRAPSRDTTVPTLPCRPIP